MRDLDVPARVHVMPVGYERDRVVLPAERLRADRVVLLAHDGSGNDGGGGGGNGGTSTGAGTGLGDGGTGPGDGDTGSGDDGVGSDGDGAGGGDAGGGDAGGDGHPHLGAIRDRLDDAGIVHETVPVDVFDFYDSIGAVATAATRFPDDDVYVNLASGSKVTAIGGMIACMATGATPYYVRAERYGGEGPSEGVAEVQELPTYPMEHPDRQAVAVLRHLAEAGPKTKKQLIAFGEAEGLVFVAGYDGDLKGKYRLLDGQVLDPLVERGYVEVSDAGRSRRVSITDVGRETLRAFSYLLE